MLEKNEILKTYGTDFRAMTAELLAETGLEALIGDRDTRIGIKPNLVSPYPADNGGTTHPEVVAGILDYLHANGFHSITILEGSWVGDRTKEAFEVCGYNALSAYYGVPLVDLQADSSSPYGEGENAVTVCDTVKSIDFLINVPVLKGHCQTKVTCALKNLKGLIPNREKRRFHALGLHRPIALLNREIRQDFIVVDHICGDLDFEDGGHPVVHNCVIAARDPVLVDSYACRLLGYTPDDVPYIRLAESFGVGSADLASANIHSIRNFDPEGDDARSTDRKLVELSDAVCEVESCSACYGYLLPALDMLREDGLLDELKQLLPERICIGQGFRGKTGAAGIGNCTAGFAFTVKGCPPTENQIYAALKEYVLSRRG